MITWHEKKRQKVIKDHGVDFEKIGDIFDDIFAVYSEDLKHSDLEERWSIIARSSAYGLIMAVYTFDNGDIHLITARRAENWMVRLYEKQRNRP